VQALTTEKFNTWLETYSRASRENDAQASAALFSADARYYESPFDEPLIGCDAIRNYWEAGAERFADKEASHEILSGQDNPGVARWRSTFTDLTTGKRLALDCLFLVEFDEQGKCCLFREWWHVRVLDSVSYEIGG
jgi:hypothetical protein